MAESEQSLEKGRAELSNGRRGEGGWRYGTFSREQLKNNRAGIRRERKKKTDSGCIEKVGGESCWECLVLGDRGNSIFSICQILAQFDTINFHLCCAEPGHPGETVLQMRSGH